MSMMELPVGDSKLAFDESTHTMNIEGSMRLANLAEYEPVKRMLVDGSQKVGAAGGVFTLDLSGLIFVNSSGITTISMFILYAKKQQNPKIRIVGSKEISWQEKSLENFSRLWPEVKVVMR